MAEIIDIKPHAIEKEVDTLSTQILEMIEKKDPGLSIALLSTVIAAHCIFEAYIEEFNLDPEKTLTEFVNDFYRSGQQEHGNTRH